MCFCTAVSPGREMSVACTGKRLGSLWRVMGVWQPRVLMWSRRENHGGSEAMEAGGMFALEKVAPLAWAQKLVLKRGWESGLRAPDFEPAGEKGAW